MFRGLRLIVGKTHGARIQLYGDFQGWSPVARLAFRVPVGIVADDPDGIQPIYRVFLMMAAHPPPGAS
jgi:hypothetical protein